MMKRTGGYGTPGTYQTIFGISPPVKTWGEIGFVENQIVYKSNLVFVPLVTNYDLNRWYKFSMQWSMGLGDYVRYRIDDGSWTAWLDPATPRPMAACDRIRFDMWALTGGPVAWLDLVAGT